MTGAAASLVARDPGAFIMLATKRRLVRGGAVLLLAALILLGVARAGVEGYAAYHIREADHALARQNYEAAKPHLEAAVRVRPTSATLHLRLGRLYRQMGQLTPAQEQLTLCRHIEGQSEEYQLEVLMMQAEAGRLDDVFEKLFVYVKEDKQPQANLVLEALILTTLSEQLYAPANAFGTKWVAKEPKNVQALYLLGAAKANLSQTEEAVELLQRAIDIDPDRDDVRRSLALVLADAHSYTSAAKHAQECLRKSPNDPLLHGILARCYLGMGDLVKARDLLDQALPEGKGEPTLLAERGKLALMLGDREEAELWLTRAMKADPSNTIAMHSMIACLTDLGKKQEAAELDERFHTLEKDLTRIDKIMTKEMLDNPSAPLFNELGTLLLKHGRDEQGLLWMYKALAKDPNYQPTNQYLADYFKSKGDLERAEQHRAALPRE